MYVGRLFYGGIAMERYELCTDRQKEILNVLYNYLGFNEVATFEEFIEFVFKGVRLGIEFDNMINRAMEHIVLSFYRDYPEYTNNYVKYIWLNSNTIMNHMKVGVKEEYDPKGLIQFYIKNNFKNLLRTKR